MRTERFLELCNQLSLSRVQHLQSGKISVAEIRRMTSEEALLAWKPQTEEQKVLWEEITHPDNIELLREMEENAVKGSDKISSLLWHVAAAESERRKYEES